MTTTTDSFPMEPFIGDGVHKNCRVNVLNLLHGHVDKCECHEHECDLELLDGTSIKEESDHGGNVLWQEYCQMHHGLCLVVGQRDDDEENNNTNNPPHNARKDVFEGEAVCQASWYDQPCHKCHKTICAHDGHSVDGYEVECSTQEQHAIVKLCFPSSVDIPIWNVRILHSDGTTAHTGNSHHDHLNYFDQQSRTKGSSSSIDFLRETSGMLILGLCLATLLVGFSFQKRQQRRFIDLYGEFSNNGTNGTTHDLSSSSASSSSIWGDSLFYYQMVSLGDREGVSSSSLRLDETTHGMPL